MKTSNILFENLQYPNLCMCNYPYLQLIFLPSVTVTANLLASVYGPLNRHFSFSGYSNSSLPPLYLITNSHLIWDIPLYFINFKCSCCGLSNCKVSFLSSSNSRLNGNLINYVHVWFYDRLNSHLIMGNLFAKSLLIAFHRSHPQSQFYLWNY